MNKEDKTKTEKPSNPPNKAKKNSVIFIVIALVLFVFALLLSFFYYNGDLGSIAPSSDEDYFNQTLLEKIRAQIIPNPDCVLTEDSSTDDYIADFLENGCRLYPDVDIAKVGGEVITTDDFNNYFFTYEQDTYFGTSLISDEKLLFVWDQLSNESIAIQEYNEEFNEQTSTPFSNSDREVTSYKDRNESLNNIESSYNGEYGNYIRGEVLTIWFYNMLEPLEGADAGMLTARRVMHYYKDKIDQDGMSFREAASEIVLRDELRVLDMSIDTNVYSSFESTDGTDIFNNDELEKAVVNLSEGHVSDVILVYDNSPDEGRIPAYYAIVRVTERSEGSSSLEDQIDNSSINDQIEIL